jgi:uncharacterized protein (DUF2252 family)
MAESPFGFFRGSAAIMAGDLAHTPVTDLRAQLCGDAHCLNFGLFATPERRLHFDVTDFDETLPGPWEWDLKRLAASLVLAARSIKLKEANATIAVISAVRSYRLRMLDFAEKTALAIWYARLDETPVAGAEPADRPRRKNVVNRAPVTSMQDAIARTTSVGPDGRRRIVDAPPLRFHPEAALARAVDAEAILASYAESIAPEVRVLFDRYRLVDSAIDVVGVGSVGTRCALALLQGGGDDTLLLQIKEADASVLEPAAGPSRYENHGQRVVRGQRLMQSAGDILLGWGRWDERDFYVRQFKDKKGHISLAAMDGFDLRDYAQLCGWALAKAHARSGDAGQIAGYLGKADTFDKALVRFGVLYADQAEQDFAAFRAAVDAGKVSIR